jgi:2-polyprenyl-6-methoxyphenol hydroxylase-like FAD-dependent oxidoreductase
MKALEEVHAIIMPWGSRFGRYRSRPVTPFCKSLAVLETDVVVVGAGPSGATTALLLARAGRQVVLIDRARFPRDKACGEGLMPPGVEVLRRLGLYDAVLATGARPVLGVTYQHPGGHPKAYAAFPPPPDGGAAWALGIRRTSFDAALVDAVRHESRATVVEGTRVTSLMRGPSGRVSGVQTDGDPVGAKVVIGADGLHSKVRAWAGLDTPSRPRRRFGLAGHWRVDTSGRDALLITLADGHEWYEAPVGPQELLVSVLDGRSQSRVTARTYEEAARGAVPAVRHAELVSRPLGGAQFHQRTRAAAAGRVFLVGDAIGYDDPTTGDGLAIGMLLAERLAEHIDALLGGAVSPAEAARRYQADHRSLVRDRRRLTQLVLLQDRSQFLSRRAIAQAARDPRTLSKLLAINCGYQRFRDLSPRDWLSLAGI